MRNLLTPQYLGWGFVGVVSLAFAVALVFGNPKLSGFVFFSTMLFTYLPFFVFPFRSVFAGYSWVRGALIGWGAFVLSQFLFCIVYQELYPLYREHGWGPPEMNGVVAGVFVGWLPGLLVTEVAFMVRRKFERDSS